MEAMEMAATMSTTPHSAGVVDMSGGGNMPAHAVARAAPTGTAFPARSSRPAPTGTSHAAAASGHVAGGEVELQSTNQEPVENKQGPVVAPAAATSISKSLHSLWEMGLSNALAYVSSFVYYGGTEGMVHSAADVQDEGLSWEKNGDLPAALECYEQARRLCRSAGHVLGEGVMCGHIGNVYHAMGLFDQALREHHARLHIAEHTSDRAAVARAHCNIGNAYMSLGNYVAALEHHKEDLNVSEDIKDKVSVRRALCNLGCVFYRMGAMENAIEHHTRELALAKDEGDLAAIGAANSNLGNALYKAGDYLQAQEHYSRALDTAQRKANKAAQARCHSNLGAAALCQKDYDGARAHLTAAIDLYNELAAALVRGGRWASLQADSVYESLAVSYDGMVQVLVAQQKTREALELVEFAHARNITDTVHMQMYKQDVAAWVKADTLTGFAVTNQCCVLEYWHTFEAGTDDVAKQEVVYVWTLAMGGELSFRRIVPTAVLSGGYTVDDLVHATLASLRTPTEARAPADELVEVMERWERGDDVGAHHMTLLRGLYRLLIEPVEELLPAGQPDARLIIAPHSSLVMVPFAALVDGEGAHVIDKHTLLLSPSVQALEMTLNREAKRKSAAAAAVAAAQADGATASSSPTTTSTTPTAKCDDVVIGVTYRDAGDAAESRPGLSEEVEAEAVLKAIETGAELMLTADADRDRVMARLAGPLRIHMAARCELTAANPFIQLGHHTILSYKDVSDLDIRAEAVVLSRCTVHSAEGLFKFCKQWMQAGATQLVMSLWCARSEAVMFFVSQWYEYHLEGAPASTALRKAMRDTKSEFPHAHDWAPFFVYG